VLVRRLDAVAVIGASVARKLMSGGLGLRPIAEQLDVPHTTVRSWWHRFEARSPTLLAECTALAVALDGTLVTVNAIGEHAALEILDVAWRRALTRFGVRIGELWSFWSRISGGQTYRAEFRPSAQLEQPYVIAGVNVIAADTTSEAQEQHLAAKRNRVRAMLGRGRTFTDEEADMILGSPAGQHVQEMFRFAAVGTPAQVSEYIDAFARYADADELIVAPQSPTTEARLRSVALLADAVTHTCSGSNAPRP
jgi:hypothetical protein